MLAGRCATICVAALLAGCGDSPAAFPVLHAAPAAYLLTVDRLGAPGFSVDTAPHGEVVTDIARGDPVEAARLTAAGFTSASAEDFLRAGSAIAVVNGPVQIVDAVEEFATAGGAASVYGSDVAALDAVAGARPLPTGALGDSAHATTRLASTADGVQLIQITVEWRVADLLNILMVRGRDGGTRAGDALVLAHRQTSAELGPAPPTPPAVS